MQRQAQQRQAMVEVVRSGRSRRVVAAQFGVSVGTVQAWVQRAGDRPLAQVDWAKRSMRPHQTPTRTRAAVEQAVLALRQELREQSALGEYGAAAIHRELAARGELAVPAVRTIHRILERHGQLDSRRRVRHAAPPPGWYLPDLARRATELDSFDVVEGLVIKGGPTIEVLTGLSLHGALAQAWPSEAVSAKSVVDALTEHWRAVGLPTYAQFDNDTRFQGPHHHPDTLGRVIRLCVSLGVTPVFAPPRETGFQAAIENFNGRWQASVWARFTFLDVAAVQAQSARFIAASRQRTAVRREHAPARRTLPAAWHLDLRAPLHGRLVFLRRASATGTVSVLGHTFPLDPQRPHRLVRCEVDLDADVIRCFGLRRRDPTDQPLLTTIAHRLPRRSFRD